MRRILLLGKKGQVGWELHRAFSVLGEVSAYEYPEINFEDLSSLRDLVLQVRPDIILNAVAYTAVDQAEHEPELVMRINADAPEMLARLACQVQAVFVHYSTDYVFDGIKRTPYTEEDALNPLGVYARSKVAGDLAVQKQGRGCIILRTSWVYSQRRDNFLKKVLHWARTQSELSVVTDQISGPTWARSLADISGQMIMQGKNELWDWANEYQGVYNLSGAGAASRFDWAEEILNLDPDRERQVVRSMRKAVTSEFPQLAPRPLYTVLDNSRFSRTFGLSLPDWRVSLRLCMDTF